MKPADIGRIVAATSPAVSPDGSQVLFVVVRVDHEENRYRSQIWLVPADGSGPALPLTSGEHADANPCWSPDGRFVTFTSKRSEKDGETTLHVLPVGAPGEMRTLVRSPEAITDLSWSPDGRWLAYTCRVRDERYDAKDESWQPPRRIRRFFSRLDDVGWIVDRPTHVHVVPVDGSLAARDLTPGEFQFSMPAWMPDSTAVVCQGAAHDTWDLDLAEDLFLVELDGGGPQPLTRQEGVYGRVSVSPDGTRVAFIGMDTPLVYPQNAHVGVLDLASGERRWVSRGLDRTFELTGTMKPPIWDSETSLLALVEDRGRQHAVRIDATGAAPPEPVLTGSRVVGEVSWRAGTLAFTASTPDQPAEVYVQVGPTERRLTRVTEPFTTAVALRPYERFTAPSSGGVEVDAWIVTPPDLDPAQRHPVLLAVHGGPHTQYGERFFDEAQLYAAAGYVVLLSNPRGSSGREEAWGQAIMGPKHPVRPGTGWGSVDVDDLLAVVDTALERYPFCDPERVGMLGGSYGGYMASWLAGHHGDRFRAICSERAVNNLLSEEWTSDIATVFRVEHGPTHLDDPEEYLRMSPISYVRSIDVPMLIVHSEKDLRCSIEQAEQLFIALRVLGKPVEFVRFPGEGHELSRSGSPVHRVQRAEIILEFFDRHLKG